MVKASKHLPEVVFLQEEHLNGSRYFVYGAKMRAWQNIFAKSKSTFGPPDIVPFGNTKTYQTFWKQPFPKQQKLL